MIPKSPDTKSWTFIGILYQEKTIKAETIECPDLFPLEDKYVLVFNTYSATTPHLIFAVVGNFDGTRFVPSNQPHRIDFGNYFYAMQTYNGAPTRVGIGWMNFWDDLSKYKDQHSFAGAMATPRQIILSPDKTKIGMVPVPQYTQYRASQTPFFAQNGFLSSPFQISNNTKTLEIQLSVQYLNGIWSVNFYENVRVTWNPNSKSISLINDFPDQKTSLPSPEIHASSSEITIILDTTSLELFLNNGTACGTLRFVPPQGSIPLITLSCPSLQIGKKINIKAWKLESIWQRSNFFQSSTSYGYISATTAPSGNQSLTSSPPISSTKNRGTPWIYASRFLIVLVTVSKLLC